MMLLLRRDPITSALGLLLLLAFSNAETHGVRNRWLQSASKEFVCPLDYVLKDTDRVSLDSSANRKLQTHATMPPPIEIVRQGQTFVDFTVRNSTSFGDSDLPLFVPDHIFTNYEIGSFGTEMCYLEEDMGSVDSAGSSSVVMSATCRSTSDANRRIAVVYIFVRYRKNKESATSNGNDIPRCCKDPYSESVSDYYTVRHVYYLECSVTCTDPEEYDGGGGVSLTDKPTAVPTAMPTGDESLPPTTFNPTTPFPTQQPTSLDLPTTGPSDEPTALDPTAYPTQTPTVIHSDEPTALDPTAYPTQTPTVIHSDEPTALDPTAYPTQTPTVIHSDEPTALDPTAYPTQTPTVILSDEPTF